MKKLVELYIRDLFTSIQTNSKAEEMINLLLDDSDVVQIVYSNNRIHKRILEDGYVSDMIFLDNWELSEVEAEEFFTLFEDKLYERLNTRMLSSTNFKDGCITFLNRSVTTNYLLNMQIKR